MNKLLAAAFAVLVVQTASAVNLTLNNQVLGFSDPTYDRVDESGVLDPNGDGVNYRVVNFYVTQSGTYDLEMAIRSANSTGDTYLFLYDGALNPTDATLGFLAGNDDTTSALTVLSGSYQSGNQGRSRINQFNLTANHQYQAVMTTFDFSATFFNDITYDLGIGNGVGNAIQGSPVPEPATCLFLGAGTLATLLRKSRRRR